MIIFLPLSLMKEVLSLWVNATCRSMGVGSVRIHMFDGIVHTLSDVHYVSDLRKSLKSLGKLASLGCKVTIDKDGLKVSKGEFIVMKD